MTRTTRHLIMGALMATWTGGGRAAVAAGVDTPALPRVRSHHPGIASLIERAADDRDVRGLVKRSTPDTASLCRRGSVRPPRRESRVKAVAQAKRTVSVVARWISQR